MRAAFGATALVALGVVLAATAGAQEDSLRANARGVRGGPSPNVAALLSNAAVALPLIASSQVSKHADSHTRSLHQVVLVSSAVVAGPAVGYLYGGCAARGLKGAAFRAAGGGLMLAVAAGANSVGEAAGGAILSVGILGAIVAGSAIWDVATVGGTVAARNRRLGLHMAVGTAPFSGAPALVLELGR